MKVLISLFFLLLSQIVLAENLKQGAQIFMDYCSGCHSLRYLRYERLSQDLGVQQFPGRPHASGEIISALSNTNAQVWFGIMPPDLSLKAREKGIDWLKQYLEGFYADSTRPFGVNNHLLPGVAMPDVLASIPKEDYEKTLDELISFLAYSAEPVQRIRYSIGIRVLLFLTLLLGLSYALKKSYWKNI